MSAINPSSSSHNCSKKYALEGAGGVILGCTELPLVVTKENSYLPVLDSTIALADAAVEYSIE